MKKIIVIFLLIASIGAIGQTTLGNFKKVNVHEKLYSTEYNLIDKADTAGQFRFQNVADPVEPLDAMNLRTFQAAVFSTAGADSIIFNPVNNRLNEYRLGEISGYTEIKFNNLTLLKGDNRTITIENPDSGDGYDLTIKAGNSYMNTGGGDLILKGGGDSDFGDVILGAGGADSVRFSSTLKLDSGITIRGLSEAVELDEPVTLSQLSGGVTRIYLPYATTVQGRINAATEGTDYPSGWGLSASLNEIDIDIDHGLGKRVANVNVCTVSGINEQLLRPFAGAYSGWETSSNDILVINSLATTPLPIVIYIIFE
jgi:hypothetical protein